MLILKRQRMVCNACLALTFVANVSIAQVVEEDSNSAYLENLKRMGIYDARLKETLNEKNVSRDSMEKMAEAGEQVPIPVDQPVSSIDLAVPSTDIVTALEMMIDASNLSATQRLQLIRHLQDVE